MPTSSHGYLTKTLDRTIFLRMRSNLHMHYLQHVQYMYDVLYRASVRPAVYMYMCTVFIFRVQ